MEAAPANQHNISNPLFPYAHPLLNYKPIKKAKPLVYMPHMVHVKHTHIHEISIYKTTQM